MEHVDVGRFEPPWRAARETAIGPGNAFYNNIFITTNGASFNRGAATNFNFVNNCYWSLNGDFKYNGGAQSSIEAFRAAGQERLNNADLGMQQDPKLEAVGQGQTIGDPTRMAELLTQYRLMSSSPCIDAGINIQTQYSINPGTRDFYNNPIPVGSAYDIGVYEHQLATTIHERGGPIILQGLI